MLYCDSSYFNSVDRLNSSVTGHIRAGILYRGSYMSAHVLLNLLNELRKEIKCEACRAFYLFFATILINTII